MRGLLFDLRQARLHPLAALHHEANFCFQPPHLRACLIKQALRLVHAIARCIVRLTNRFQLAFNFAQIRDARLQRIDRRVLIRLDLGLLAFCIRALQKPQLLLLGGNAFLQGFVFLRHLGLLFQLLQVGIELAQDIVHAGEVFSRV